MELRQYKPNISLRKHIDAYWFYRNTTGKTIYFPVVPDGCSDIVFYLNDPKKLGKLRNPFVTGIMEHAQLIPIPDKMELFGIRFRPSMLFYLLKTDMGKLANNMSELSQVNNAIFKSLRIYQYTKNKRIVSNIELQLKRLLQKNDSQDNFLKIVGRLIEAPQTPIKELSTKEAFSPKNLQRLFHKRIGLTPKKFARIMMFQKAHKQISKEGLKNLVIIALSSGYFDQAHFNREYKKLVGYNPSHETMSILYNT